MTETSLDFLVENEEKKSVDSIASERDKKILLRAKYIELFILFCTSAIQCSLVTGSVAVSMTSIEKVFKLSNFFMVMVLTVYNIFCGIVSIPLTYFSKNQRQTFISLGMFLICLGTFIFIMPVFIVSRQTIDVQAKSYLCMENTSVPHAKEGTHQQLSLTLMYIGYALIGIGSAPLFTIAINYILETFDESQTPLFTTIYYTCQVLGIVFVFILGKIALNIPMFPWKEQDSQLTPDQDNWVGAYWVIYLIGFFIMLFLLIANLIVSQYIKYKSKTVNLPPKQDKTTKRSFSNLFSSVLGVVKNVKLFLMIISYACVNLAENSIANYLQMYLEVQFQMSPDNAAIWGGVPAIFSTVIGLYLSSLLMKKYCSDNQKLFLIHMTAATLSVVCLVASSFYCEQEKIHGLKQDQAVISGFDTAYYDSCGCSVEDYFPVCLNGKSTYYSPCILGCKNVSNNHGGKTFTDCFNSQPHPEYKLTEGNCPKKCFKLVPFLILGNLSIFFICLSSMTSLQSEINLSEGDSFDLALGIKAVLCRILQIIGPVLYGLLFDFSCSIKRPLVGGDITSNCIEYDQKKMT